MKQTRKILAMLLCIAMVLGMATTVFADENYTITINNETAGYEYVAYQVFDGDLVDGQLTNIAWGANIDSAKIDEMMTALKAIEAFAECTNAVSVATVLGNDTTADNATAVAFADVISQYLTGTPAKSDYADSKYTIEVPAEGYYLVKNTQVPNATETTATGAYTRYILKVVGNVTVSHKGSVPAVEKKILETTTDDQGKETTARVDANTAEIGETVTYEFVGTMPSNIADYDTYYYLFTDTMSDGLTYTNTVTVTVNGKDVTKYFYKNVIENDDDTTTLKVGIVDILALENVTDPAVGEITAATKVVVTYTAIVDEDANIGVNGETNEVKLQFSNNPNDDGNGTTNPPDVPGDDDEMPKPQVPTGETPKDIVKTYTTEIEITKKDALTQETLTGAKFSISGHSSQVMVVNREMFVQDDNGTYYRLKNGTYTTEEPVYDDDEATTDTNEKTSDSYDLVDGVALKYKKVEVVSTETITVPFEAEGWVNAQGVITFTGLGEGTYEITEIVAPDGYNKLEDSIEVVITSNVGSLIITEGTETVTWTATVDDKAATVTTDGVVKFDVENTSGSTLPETGGIGTTLFYVFGGIMVLGAAVLLVTKKRMAV